MMYERKLMLYCISGIVDGSSTQVQKCPVCGGSGVRVITQQLGPGFITQTQTTYENILSKDTPVSCVDVFSFIVATSVVVRARLLRELAQYAKAIKSKQARTRLLLLLRRACRTVKQLHVSFLLPPPLVIAYNLFLH